jgi:hypothetical protein
MGENTLLDPGEIAWNCVDWFALNKEMDKWPAFVSIDIKIRVP